MNDISLGKRILKTTVEFYPMSTPSLYLRVYNFLCCYKTIQKVEEVAAQPWYSDKILVII